MEVIDFKSAPDRARTCGLQLRRLPLYPTELRARIKTCQQLSGFYVDKPLFQLRWFFRWSSGFDRTTVARRRGQGRERFRGAPLQRRAER